MFQVFSLEAGGKGSGPPQGNQNARKYLPGGPSNTGGFYMRGKRKYTKSAEPRKPRMKPTKQSPVQGPTRTHFIRNTPYTGFVQKAPGVPQKPDKYTKPYAVGISKYGAMTQGGRNVVRKRRLGEVD